MELVVATNTALSRQEIHDMYLYELVQYVDYIQAQQVMEAEANIDEYSTLLAIASAPHSKDGGKKLAKHFEKAKLMMREIDEGALVEPTEEDRSKLLQFLQQKRAK